MFIDRLEVHNNTMINHTALITHTPHIYSHIKYININLKKTVLIPTHINRYIINNYMLRMSLHQAHILLKNGVADLTIQFTIRLSEFIILLLKLNTNLRKSSPNDGIFKFTNIN